MRALACCTMLLFVPLAMDGQAAPPVVVPAGARVKAQMSIGTVEGSFLSWRHDTLVMSIVGSGGHIDTFRVAKPTLQGVRVLETPPLWTYSTTSDIRFYDWVAVPEWGEADSSGVHAMRHLLLVASRGDFTALDPATGKVIWTRTDLSDLNEVGLGVIGATGYGMLTRGARMETIDLRTGRKGWEAGSLPLSSAQGWLPLPGIDSLLLMYGSTPESPATLLAVEVATGKVRWRQNELFTIPPKPFTGGGTSYLLGNQTPLADTDTSVVLYLSKDGPIRIDARTGVLLWKAEGFAGADVPSSRDGYAHIGIAGGVLYVPSEKRLFALNDSDGRALWTTPRTLKSRVISMRQTGYGLLVRGEDWTDLLNPATGASVWHAPVELKSSTRTVVSGDTAFVVADKEALAIRIPDGAVRMLARVKFDEGEVPVGLRLFDEGLVLSSWHNLALVDRQGNERYQRHYPSPKESFGETLREAGTGLSMRRPATMWTDDGIYFFTGAPDRAEREGFSLVEVDPGNGEEQGRVWFDERVPDYLIMSWSGMVCHKKGGRELDGLSFYDWAALASAARNGPIELVSRLLDMGADPNVKADDGWTALDEAASRGHVDVVRLLLARGANPAVTTRTGWSAWMLAVSYGRTDAAEALRDAGGGGSAAADSVLHGWYLAGLGRISEALTAYGAGQSMDSTLNILPFAWRALCWDGAVWNQAAAVLPACEQAVARAPVGDKGYAGAHLARGIARALTGDLNGAATDLAVASGPEEDGRITAWLDDLRAGRSPFTSVVLERLRKE